MLKIKIDGATYTLPITLDAVQVSADFLEQSANRTNDGTVHIVTIGLYESYQITTGSFRDKAEYQRLYSKLTENARIHTVTLPGVGGDQTFRAYFSSIKHKLRKKDAAGNYHWTGLSFRVTPEKPKGK